MESARLATETDVEVFVDIGVEHAQSIDGDRGADLLLRLNWPPDRDQYRSELEAAIDNDQTVVVAGTYDDVVFGLATMEFLDLNDGSVLGRLGDFLVAEPARGVGIGEAMMNLLLEKANERGCIGIDAMALPGDRETKNFFESFGLKARKLTVHRSLQADD